MVAIFYSGICCWIIKNDSLVKRSQITLNFIKNVFIKRENLLCKLIWYAKLALYFKFEF